MLVVGRTIKLQTIRFSGPEIVYSANVCPPLQSATVVPLWFSVEYGDPNLARNSAAHSKHLLISRGMVWMAASLLLVGVNK